MSKDLGCKWNFIERNESSQEQGREDSSFDYFKEKERCLVREYIQNSMDAYSERNGFPYVTVEFSFGELLCADYPELIQSLPARIKACSDYCQGNNAKDPYDEKYKYLQSHINGSIGYLKVSDFNTKGMPYDPNRFNKSKFKSCVRSANSSHKDAGNAGGSHGKGKTVGFVNSNINAVYYSTMTEDGNCYGEGVIKLCDHIFLDSKNEKQIYEDVAFYDSQQGKHPDTDNIPLEFRRTVAGTDAYVLGIEQSDDLILKMKKEVLRSFFKAIKENLLRVIVCGEEINSTNISEKLVVYFEEEGELDVLRTRNPELEFNPRPYFEEALCKAGTDENHRVFDTEVDFPEEFRTLGKTLVYFWKSDKIKQANSRDSVVYMRNNNMAIEVKRGRNNKGYYAVFCCEGAGSEYLRHMENVTHDKWDDSEATKEKKPTASRILLEIKQLILKCEMAMFPEEEGQEKAIKSLKNRRISSLGNNKADDEESMWPSSNVNEYTKTARNAGSSSTLLESIQGKRKKKKSKGGSATRESDPTPSLTPSDFSATNEPDPDDPKPGHKPDPNPDPTPQSDNENPKGFPSTPAAPTVDGDGELEGNSNEVYAGGTRLREITIDGSRRHLIPLHDGEYACKLVLNVTRDYHNCKLELFVQGVNGKIPLRLKNVSNGCQKGGIDENEIFGFDLHPGDNVIKFTPQENVTIYTLIIKAYGN